MFRVKQHQARAISWWYEQYREGRLDLSPAYQRRSDIWGEWKQAHLIDSILNSFDIPKFYVADFSSFKSANLNREKRPYAIIDGKQRFEALFKFFAGELALNQTFELLEERSTELAGFTYLDLKKKFPRYASTIEDFEPVVMSVITDEEKYIDELFVRLNSGEATTRAERRNAMPGPIPRILRDLVMHPFFQKNVAFNKKRMQDFNLAVKLLLIEYRNGFADTKAKDLDHFVTEAYKTEEAARTKGKREEAVKPYRDAEARVLGMLEKLSKQFKQRDPLLAAQGNIPVYYWFAHEHVRQVTSLRGALVRFSANVKEALKISKTDPDDADAELLSYYTMGRTTNDKKSLQGRYDILRKRLFRN